MKYGLITQLAKQTGVSVAHMSFILRRLRRPSSQLAEKLEAITGIRHSAWLYPDVYHNPYIQGSKPSEEEVAHEAGFTGPRNQSAPASVEIETSSLK